MLNSFIPLCLLLHFLCYASFFLSSHREKPLTVSQDFLSSTERPNPLFLIFPSLRWKFICMIVSCRTLFSADRHNHSFLSFFFVSSWNWSVRQRFLFSHACSPGQNVLLLLSCGCLCCCELASAWHPYFVRVLLWGCACISPCFLLCFDLCGYGHVLSSRSCEETKDNGHMIRCLALSRLSCRFGTLNTWLFCTDPLCHVHMLQPTTRGREIESNVIRYLIVFWSLFTPSRCISTVFQIYFTISRRSICIFISSFFVAFPHSYCNVLQIRSCGRKL